jgi:hypothetical protein
METGGPRQGSGFDRGMRMVSGSWLFPESPRTALTVVFTGLFCALLIHHLGFLRLVDKNLRRILPINERRCFFSFIPWKNYLLILSMAFLGHMVRNSGLPKPVLGALYIAIGSALLLSSIRYFRFFLKMPIQN